MRFGPLRPSTGPHAPRAPSPAPHGSLRSYMGPQMAPSQTLINDTVGNLSCLSCRHASRVSWTPSGQPLNLSLLYKDAILTFNSSFLYGVTQDSQKANENFSSKSSPLPKCIDSSPSRVLLLTRAGWGAITSKCRVHSALCRNTSASPCEGAEAA